MSRLSKQAVNMCIGSKPRRPPMVLGRRARSGLDPGLFGSSDSLEAAGSFCWSPPREPKMA